MAEAGCSNQEIKAITGHKTEAEVTRYTKAADQRNLADLAMTKMTSNPQTGRSSNLLLRFEDRQEKTLEKQRKRGGNGSP